MRLQQTWRHRGVAVLSAIVLAVIVPIGSSATAAAPTTVALSSDEHGRVLTAAPSVVDKVSLLRTASAPQAPAALSGGPSASNRNQWVYPSARTQGRDGELVALGSTYVEMPYLNYYAYFKNSSSRVAWLGTSPFVADNVTHTDQWHLDYFGGPFTASRTPAGAQIAADSGSIDVKWTTTVAGNWYSEHSWDQVDFMPVTWFGQIYRIRHTVTGTFQFGSSFYTVSADGRAFTW
jgi:hypothetical protein